MTLRICLLFSILLLEGCFLNQNKLLVSFNNKQTSDLTTVNVSGVTVTNNQLVITGTNLADIKTVKVKNTSIGLDQSFSIESQTNNQIIANAISATSLILNQTVDLIIGTASASATFPVSFTVSDHSLDLVKLSTTGVTSGNVIKFNGTDWVAAPQNETQVYLGTWDAGSNSPNLSTVSNVPGDYYIVSTAGTFNSVSYAVGDWIISDGYSWQKIPVANTSVTSFQDRKGIVTLRPSDYVSLKDTTTLKITGSKLQDFADVDVTGIANGQILKWNSSTSKWVAANDNSAASGIALTDLSATAPLAYNNTTGVFTLPTANVLALPLTGLTSGTGAISATDTILGAFGKLMTVPTDYISKTSGANLTTGTIALSGTAMITIPTATGTTLTEAANVTYVNNAIEANGVWSKNGTAVYYNAGNVGIGTTAPISLLANTASNIADSAATGIHSSGTAWSITGSGFANAIYNSSTSATANGLLVKGAGSASTNILFGVDQGTSQTAAGTALFRVLGNGNVGIGTTSPTSILHTVASGAKTADYIGNYLTNTATSSTASLNKTGLNVQSTGTWNGTTAINTGLVVNATGGTTNYAATFSGGNVGIGTTSPAYPLDVVGNIYSSGTVRGTGTLVAAGSAASPSVSIGNSGGLFSAGTGLIGFSTSAVERMRIDNVGNVGIGTTSPSTTSILELSSTTKGFLLPRMTTAQRDAIASPATGLTIYNTTTNRNNVYNGTSWGVVSEDGLTSLDSLSDAITSSTNLYLGDSVGAMTTTGYSNTAVGIDAMTEVTTGVSNTGVGSEVLSSLTSGQVNTGVGRDALLSLTSGNGNTAVGGYALASTTTATGNVAIGEESLVDNITGGANVAIGLAALYSNTTASNNTAVGSVALYSNTTGTRNTAVGSTSLNKETTGGYNTSIGTAALAVATTPSYNTAVGDSALGFTTTGGSNTALGHAASLYNTTGSGNVSIGYYAGQNIKTGSSNITIGTSVDAVSISASNQLNIGNLIYGDMSANKYLGIGSVTVPTSTLDIGGAFTVRAISAPSVSSASTGRIYFDSTSNKFQVSENAGTYSDLLPWTQSGTNLSYSAGVVGIGGAANSSYALYVTGNAYATGAFTSASDKRFKKEITPIENAIDKVMSLAGVTYFWKADEFPEKKFDDKKHYGFIAQEVEKILPELVHTDDVGYKSVEYATMTSILVEAFKNFYADYEKNNDRFLLMTNGIEKKLEQHSRKIASLESKVKKLESENEMLKSYLCAKDKSAPFCSKK